MPVEIEKRILVRRGRLFLDALAKPGGPAPRDILLANMWFHWNQVLRTEAKIKSLQETGRIDDIHRANMPVDDEAKDLIARHLTARRDAGEYAQIVAPLVHPRLSAVRVKVADNDPSQLADAELIEALQTLSADELGMGEGEPETVDVEPET